MSITINIAGNLSVLADGKWRSADAQLAEMLNDHLATLRVPAHYPPAYRELEQAQAAARELGARIIDRHPLPADRGRRSDGRLKVY